MKLKKMMQLDFTKPNRQSSSGLFIIYVKTLVKIVKGTFVLFGYISFKLYDNIENYWTYFFIAIFLLLIITLWFAYKNFKNFIFYVNEEDKAFVLEKGIFTKEKTIINFDKIVQINIAQPLLLQVFDLYKLNIETSGSAIAEVNIDVLDEPTALALQEYLYTLIQVPKDSTILENSTTDAKINFSDNKELANENSVIKIPNAQILFAGIFTNYTKGIGLALLFLSFLLSQFKDFASFLGFETSSYIYEVIKNGGLKDLMVFLSLLLVSPIIINLFRQVIRYFNLQYNYHSNNEIQFEYGLFELQKRIFNINKLQLVKVHESILLRLKKLSFVILKQVETGPKDKSALLLPGLNQNQSTQMLYKLFKQNINLENAIQPSLRKFFVYLIFSSIFITISISSIALINAAMFKPALAIGVSILVVIALFLYKRTTNESLYWDRGVIICKKGWIDITYTYCFISSVQFVSKSQMLWQKKSNLGSLSIQTAAGSLNLDYYNFDMLSKLQDVLLYKIESTT